MVETKGYTAFMEVLNIIKELNDEEAQEFVNLLDEYIRKEEE